jgi:hypothetical protein
MKIRAGFVSNSSSSSFVCEISGSAEGGYDASPSDCGMARCVNYHTFMQEFILDDTGDLDYDELPSEHCPICSMKEVSTDMLLTYLIDKSKKDRAALTEEIREKFRGNVENFEAAMRNLKK